MARYKSFEEVQAAITQRIADLRGINPGAANDLLQFTMTGQPPATPAGQAALASILKESPFATPAAYISAAQSFAGNTRSETQQATAQGTPPTRSVMPTGTAAATAPSTANSDAPGLTSGTGQTMTLADRLAAAARAAASSKPAATGGVSSANDNGIGGGGPEGAAAQAAVAQQATLPNGAGAQAPGAPGASQTSSSPSLPGGFNPAQGNALSKDDDLLLSFALRAAGFDPNHVTRYSKLAAQALLPLLQSRRNAYGLSGGEGGALANVGGLPQDIAQFAKDFTTKGMDFYGNAQRYAQQAMNGETFKNSIAGLADQEQVAAMYQSMMPLLYAGSNPLVQQAAGDTFRRQMENFNYRDAGFDLPGTPASNGVLMDWLGSQQNVDPITRRIFGLK